MILKSQSRLPHTLHPLRQAGLKAFTPPPVNVNIYEYTPVVLHNRTSLRASACSTFTACCRQMPALHLHIQLIKQSYEKRKNHKETDEAGDVPSPLHRSD